MRNEIEKKFKIRLAEFQYNKDENGKVIVLLRFEPGTPVNKAGAIARYVKNVYIVDKVQVFM